MSSDNFIEGRGMLWQAANPVAPVDYHISRPMEAHLLLNPLGQLRFDSSDLRGGFILLRPGDVDKISLAEYTLQTAHHGHQTIQVTRRYKETTHQGQTRVAFWVQVR